MTEERDWSIVFYTTEQGDSPVEEFLESLDLKTQARFDWSIEQLRVRNTRAREPLVKHIEGKLWELRRASNGNIYRLMYFFLRVNGSCLYTDFRKSPQKRPSERLKPQRSE